MSGLQAAAAAEEEDTNKTRRRLQFIKLGFPLGINIQRMA
jgi:hypothetical protein